jgi:tRNA threonylcarbamoyladenosine biosynthesis protein TsaE
MERLGARLAVAARAGAIVYLRGDLGAGKTTFVRGLLRAFDPKAVVKSPTYTLIEPYRFGTLTIMHFDLYRLRRAAELEDAGLRDAFTGDCLCLVEWPERGLGYLPPSDLDIEIKVVDDHSRALTATATSEHGRKLLETLLAQPGSARSARST